jgi:hypothetical protein
VLVVRIRDDDVNVVIVFEPDLQRDGVDDKVVGQFRRRGPTIRLRVFGL